MSELTVPLTKSVKAERGDVKKLIFKEQPSAKQLMEFGSFINPDRSFHWGILSAYIVELTDFGISEVERISQPDLMAIAQSLYEWTFLDEKK